MQTYSFILGSIAALFLSGCMVGPNYQRPQIPLPKKWDSSPLSQSKEDKQTLQTWWQSFNDPVLTVLINQAKIGNRDIYQAEARIREARANRAQAIANILPTLSMNASASKNQPSNASRIGQVGAFSNEYNEYSHSLDASWELDLFGKRRRSIESAKASMQAAVDDYNDVLVSLYAEVALNYVDVRSYQNRLAVTKENLVTQEETYELVSWQEKAGLVSMLDVFQAKLTLENTRSDIPKLKSGLEQAKHGLAVLLGKEPASLNTLLENTAPIPAVSKQVATGIPADVLRQRPDVRRSERKLAAQTAQIGVAEAAAYPSFTLSGSVGVESLLTSNLYTAAANTFFMAVKSAWVIFDSGRIRSNVKIQNSLQEQALGSYQESILNALKEVENSLTAYTQEQQRLDALKASVQAGKSALELANEQYLAGTVDFLKVLDSQKSLLTAQSQLVASEAEATSNVIRLYKALGGGWNIATSSNTRHG
jgi:NodT family efflux transporter outer membrane factor (OMF) lipoprotein